MSERLSPAAQHDVTLLELVDRVLNKGVVVTGDITLSVADVDLVYVGLRVLLASVGTMERLDAERAQVLYVYAFVAAPASVPSVPGLGGAPLRSQRADSVEAVVSEHEVPIRASEAAVVDHARVVEAVTAANAAVLPVRFGGMHADEAALREAVAGRTELAAALERVRGCVELGLRVLSEAAAPANPSSGGAYMRARLEQRHELERLADELHAPLAAVARESTVATGTTPRLLLTAAYLVPREDVDGFRTMLASLQSRHPELGIVCTGPWPPYSFALAREGGS